MTVNGIDYFITNAYGEEFYNSCKDVKFGSMNTRVMDFIGGSAQNYKGMKSSYLPILCANTSIFWFSIMRRDKRNTACTIYFLILRERLKKKLGVC